MVGFANFSAPSMNSKVLDPLVHFIDGATVLLIIGGVAKVFEWLEGGLNEEKKGALASWLRDTRVDSKAESWTTVFPSLIDRVFGTRPLSIEFIFRSCIASLIAVALTVVFYARAHGINPLHSPDTTLLVGSAVISNCIPDYLSLLVSRAIVKWMARNPRSIRVAYLLLLDVAVTAIIAVGSAWLAELCVGATMMWNDGHLDSLGIFWEYMLKKLPYKPGFFAIFRSSSPANVFTTFFYSAFFTSVWVWLYVVSAAVIKLLHKTQAFWTHLLGFLDLDEKPLSSVGRVAGLLAGASYLTLLGALWLGAKVHHAGHPPAGESTTKQAHLTVPR
jgi:hypothetical protein